MVNVTCLTCGLIFESERRSRKTCSYSCRSALTRRKRGVPERSSVQGDRKYCKACDQTLSLADFTQLVSGPKAGKYVSYCKPCNAAKVRERTRQARGLASDAKLSRGRQSKPEGSRFVNSKGYVLLKQSEHPRADKGGWVAEHIVIAEAKYGMLVSTAFTVHHKNADRTDNRPENLELRVGPHGKGGEVLPVLLRLSEQRRVAAELLREYGYTVVEPTDTVTDSV